MLNSFYEWKNRIDPKDSLQICVVEESGDEEVLVRDATGILRPLPSSGQTYETGTRLAVQGKTILHTCPDLEDGGIQYL